MVYITINTNASINSVKQIEWLTSGPKIKYRSRLQFTRRERLGFEGRGQIYDESKDGNRNIVKLCT